MVKSLVLLHALQFPDFYIISFIHAGNGKIPFPKHFDKAVKKGLLPLFHAQGQHLHRQHVAETVHRHARQLIRLSEHQAAAVIVLLPHHLEPVIHRIGSPPFPENFIKPIIGIGGKMRMVILEWGL